VSDDLRQRLRIDLTPEERAAYEAAAAREGLSLEAWMKRAFDRGVRRDPVARRFGMDPGAGWWPGLLGDQ
jgi:hypothetical protein